MQSSQFQYTQCTPTGITPYDLYGKCIPTFQETKSKRPTCYLDVEKISKMISRFFTETQISKEALAKTLGISVKGLNWLYLQKAPPALIRKINLPLIHLYCKTKFNNKN
jgi:hypothetical protein